MARIRTKTFTHPDLPGNVYTFAVETEDFSISKNYSAGQYCIYNGDLYRFTADHSAGAWSGSDATQVLLADDLAALKEEFNNSNIIHDSDDNKYDTVSQTVENGYLVETFTEVQHG